MKKLFLFIMLLPAATLVYSQKSIDNLFEKYAGKDGFTTVTINGNLLNFLHSVGDKDEDLPANITEIRVLAQDDKEMNVENFYDLVMKEIDLNSYDEFMRVKKSDENVRMLVKSDGNKFKEFLLIAGGKDNAVVQIKGNLTYEEAKKLSNDAKKDVRLNISSGHNE